MTTIPPIPEQREKKKTSKKFKRIILIIIAVIIFLCVIISIISSSTPSAKATATAKVAATLTAKPTATPIPTETPVPTETPIPLPTNTLEPRAAVKHEIMNALGSGNRDVPRLTELTFDDPEPGDLIVKWAINDNLTEGLIRHGARMDATYILQAIDQSGYDYTYITMIGTFPLIDAYGNTEEKQVVSLIFEKATVEKINWEGFINDNIYVIADGSVIHPLFQDQ